MDYLLFLFDFDYTLVDSSRGIVISFNCALQDMGYPVRMPAEIRKTIGQSLEAAFYKLSGSRIYNEFLTFKECFMRYSKLYMVDCAVIFDGVIATFSELKKRNKKVGIISSKDHFTIERISERNNFLKYIDIIIGEDDVTNQKPSPDALYYAASKLNVDSTKVLFIGDSVGDAQTALNANIDFLPIISGVTKADEFDPYKKIGIIYNLHEVSKYMR